MEENDSLIQDNSGGSKFCDATDKEDRINFVRKVYSILGLQLLLTACITLVPLLN